MIKHELTKPDTFYILDLTIDFKSKKQHMSQPIKSNIYLDASDNIVLNVKYGAILTNKEHNCRKSIIAHAVRICAVSSLNLKGRNFPPFSAIDR